MVDDLAQPSVPGQSVPMGTVEERANDAVPHTQTQALARHGLVSLSTSVLIQLINVVTGVLIARLLGPQGRGELTAALLWPSTLAIIGGLGTTEAIAYFVSREPSRAREIFATGILLAALEATIVMGAAYLLLPVLLAHYGSDVLLASRLYLLWIPLMLFSLVGAEVLRGRLALSAFNILRVFVVLASLAGLLVLVAVHRLTVVPIVWAYIAANVLTLLIALGLLCHYRSCGLRARPALLRRMLAYGLKAHVGNIFVLINMRADQALISLFLMPASLGLYAVAISVTSPVTLVGGAMALVALPAIGIGASSSEMRIYFARFVRTVLALSAVACLVLIVLAPVLIVVVFGRPFEAAIAPARWLLLTALMISVNDVLTAGLNAFNRPLVPSVAQLFSTVTIVLALIVLLPLYGIVGAALAAAVAHAIATACMIWYARTRLQVPLSSLVPSLSDLVWLRSIPVSWVAKKFSNSDNG